jgi:ATP-dependent helicase IRC3
MKPRRYQERALESFKDWSQDKESLATIILPTGVGKTFAATLCFDWLYKTTSNVKLLWAAHREELIDQAARDLSRIDNVKIEIEMADNVASSNADVIVGSVQTLHKNRKNIKGFTPTHIVVDEWHHYSDKNVQYKGLLEKYPDAKVLGLTATPYRFTGGDLPLGRKLIEMDTGTAVRHNYLVTPVPDVIKTNVSLANVRKRLGDFAINELSAAVNVKERNVLIAKRIIKAVKEEKRQGILFGVDVAHAHQIYELVKDEVRAAEVYGETDKEERRYLMEKVRGGEVDVLCNNLVCTEGFDVPHLSFVCIARPTASLGLYTQMAGRGLRLFENKKDCIIIDVFDKIKTTQSRVTYSDLAKAGDIDGSNKRIGAILKEPVADELKNFPIMLTMNDDERLSVDNDTWFAPAWLLSENQWVISWTKSEERIKVDGEFDYTPLSFMPNHFFLQKNMLQVKHRFFGTGLATGSDSINMVTVNFDGLGIKQVPFSELMKQDQKYEKRKLDTPIRRVMYICLTNSAKGAHGRLISLLQYKNTYKVVDDIKGDKSTIDEFVRASATQDDMLQIIRSDAKWRDRSISDKQKSLINKFIQTNKVKDDVDINNMTAGDASNIIDQISWRPAINLLFCTDEQHKLIGYNSLMDDV